MSGLFKSFSNFISQSSLTQAHKYLLRSTNNVLHPTGYYYKSQTLQPGHGLDIFQLSVTSAALTYQANDYQDLLQSQKSEELKREVQERLDFNIKAINSHFQELLVQLKFGQELTFQSVADIVYVLAYGEQEKEDAHQLIRHYLAPVMCGAKLDYASVQNLKDILNSLNKLNYNDNILLAQLLNQLNQKETGFINVSLHGWSTNQYEKCCSKCGWNLLSCGENHFRSYIESGGNSNFLSKASFAAKNSFDQLVLRILNPFLFRENKVIRRFESRNEKQEDKKFHQTLEDLLLKLGDQKQVIEELQQKY